MKRKVNWPMIVLCIIAGTFLILWVARPPRPSGSLAPAPTYSDTQIVLCDYVMKDMIHSVEKYWMRRRVKDTTFSSEQTSFTVRDTAYDRAWFDTARNQAGKVLPPDTTTKKYKFDLYWLSHPRQQVLKDYNIRLFDIFPQEIPAGVKKP